jgi:VIT1/CCC1 family predicted Fe2+/Mn2+ transporter
MHGRSQGLRRSESGRVSPLAAFLAAFAALTTVGLMGGVSPPTATFRGAGAALGIAALAGIVASLWPEPADRGETR